MNKEWFIFKGTHHLGPFSVEEVASFLASKEISAQTLIWKEGAEKWEPLSKVAAFAHLFQKPALKKEEAPPPLPHIPTLPPKAPAQLMSESLSEGEEEELPPPIPLDAILNPKGEPKLTFGEPSKRKSSNLSKYFFLLLTVFFVGLVAWFLQNEKNAAISFRIKGLMPVYLERLEMAATKNSAKFEVAMALSLDSQTLYASSNIGGEVQTIIKLNSIPKRVLGAEDVAVTVKGVMNDHLGKYTKMTLTQGSRFLPGEYQIHVEARQIHYLNRHFKTLSGIAFFKSLNKSYSFDGEALIYPGTPREFEKKMADYKETLIAEMQKPFQDKLERIQTFESLLNQTSQNYLMELEKAKTGKAIASFEKKFIKEISPLLQSLVVKANELSQDPKINEANKVNVVSSYKSQVLLGKQIGEMASDMITKTSSYKKLTDKDKSALRVEFERRSHDIKIQIDLNVKLLQAELAKITR